MPTAGDGGGGGGGDMGLPSNTALCAGLSDRLPPVTTPGLPGHTAGQGLTAAAGLKTGGDGGGCKRIRYDSRQGTNGE